MGERAASLRPRVARHMLAAEKIGRKIVSGELSPGTTLPNATDLARQLQIARPAMREAIKLLAGKGLVESAPRRGTVVTPQFSWNRLDHDVLSWQMDGTPNAAFVRGLYELRRIVEPEAAAYAALRADSRRTCRYRELSAFDVERQTGVSAFGSGRCCVSSVDPCCVGERLSSRLWTRDQDIANSGIYVPARGLSEH